MRQLLRVLIPALLPALALANPAQDPPAQRPTVADVRKTMGIPSQGDVRGQQDAIGYATRAEQMAKIWDLALQAPAPPSLGDPVTPGVVALLGPHDDYVYAAPLQRRLFPLVTAKIVVMVGVFHGYRRFGEHDRLVFSDYRAWRSPDGDIAVSPLRDELFARLAPDARVMDSAAHDSEHSLESIAYWLKHQRADVEIVPIIVPVASFARLGQTAAQLGAALAASMRKRHLTLGKDVAIIISTDGTHYGNDFEYTPFGAGGVEAYQKALAQERALIMSSLAGPVSVDKANAFYAATVDPAHPDQRRMTWCGRFSVPFGLLLLLETTKALGMAPPRGVPLMLGSSIDTPGVRGDGLGIGPTAPASLYHFVFQPGVAFVPR
jgi:AmmeMemoRadiSam system protein B